MDNAVVFLKPILKCFSGRPGEPAQMKCKCTGSTNIRMGETMKGDNDVHIKDKHGNEIKQVKILCCLDFQEYFLPSATKTGRT